MKTKTRCYVSPCLYINPSRQLIQTRPFNQVERIADVADQDAEEGVFPSAKRRGSRKPLPADLPRIEVIHEEVEYELTCTGGCHKHAIGYEISEKLELDPVRIRVIDNVRKVHGCRACEAAPVAVDTPGQLIEKLSPAQTFWRCC